MIKLKYIIALLYLVTLVSCYKETPITVEAKFEISLKDKDKSVPVNVKILNKTENADSYKWTFSGASITSSTDKNPNVATYEKAGTYTIKLEAKNVDGESDIFEKEITIVEGIAIDFVTEIVMNNYPPVEVVIKNNTKGEKLTYKWTFEGGNISSSEDKTPKNIVFKTPGIHKIKLAVSNGFETISKETTIEVSSDVIVADFDWNIGIIDEDYEVPVHINLENKSKNGIKYNWFFEGANLQESEEKNLGITFETPGIYPIKLVVTNGKTSKEIIKTITVKADKNLLSFTDVKLGISTAHSNNTIGAFFSSQLKKTLKAEEVTAENGSKIDIAFLGINNKFRVNEFVSPSKAGENGFNKIPNAIATKIINRQEICDCGTALSVSEFDQMTNDSSLKSLSVNETSKGLLHFSNTLVPRIVIFQTKDGRKGVIKITNFVEKGRDSYIHCDIKIQKTPK